jgi:cephalosporin-C deacetylase-like acetyl esterase
VDEICYPSAVYAFYNALPNTITKFIHTDPITGHYGTTSNPEGAKRLAKGFNTVTVSSDPL